MENTATAAETRLCLQCSKPLKGRSDKQFCNPDCKNQYHKANETEYTEVFKRVSKLLRANRNILKETLGTERSLKTTIEKLEAKGFEKEYLTQIREVGASKRKYYFVLDYGYRVEDDGAVVVVKAYWT